MGKTQSGAVWLDPEKTSPFEFYQYWRNVDDADVIKCMRLLTFLPLEEIDEMAKWEGSQLNKAKEILAYELTNLVHGEEEAKKAGGWPDGYISVANKLGILHGINIQDYKKPALRRDVASIIYILYYSD